MPAPTSIRSFAGGHYELDVDTWRRSAYVKSFKAGLPKINLVHEKTGNQPYGAAHAGTIAIDPFEMDIGMSSMGGALQWIKDCWSNNPRRISGQVTHADFNMKVTSEHEFLDASLKEVTFPGAGAETKDMYMKVAIQPESTKYVHKPSERKVTSEATDKQKLWTGGSFRLTIDGLGNAMRGVDKIEPFKITQKVATATFGDFRPEYEGCGVDMPELTGTISEAYVGPLADWHQKYAGVCTNDNKGQLSGQLTYTKPNRKDELFTIQLYKIMPMSLDVETLKANEPSIRRWKFKLKVESVGISASNLGIA